MQDCVKMHFAHHEAEIYDELTRLYSTVAGGIVLQLNQERELGAKCRGIS